MDKLKDLAGKVGGGDKKPPAGGGAGQDDYLDKGISAAEQRMGAGNVSEGTNEQITDKGREMFERGTGGEEGKRG
ncbi:MAG: hypothetical protein Q9177_001818 [Variospora cf. flavescens]